MIKWFCSLCGEPADYHAADSHGNKYYCTKHWWNHVQQIDGVDIHGVVADSSTVNKDIKDSVG